MTGNLSGLYGSDLTKEIEKSSCNGSGFISFDSRSCKNLYGFCFLHCTPAATTCLIVTFHTLYSGNSSGLYGSDLFKRNSL